MKNNTIAVMLTVFLSSATALGWGGNTHKFIGKEFGKHVPVSMGFVLRNIDAISAHSSDPDNRKNAAHPLEEFKHYIDQDVYPEFFTGTLTHNLDSLFRQKDSSYVTNNGILPWAIAWTFDSLVVAFKTQDSSKLILYLSDLSHYVADATQPLHVTNNYNPGGLHSRYETAMMNAYLSTIVITPVIVAPVTRPIIDDAFDLAAATYPYVDSVIKADAAAKLAAGGSTSGTVYNSTLWSLTQSLTVKMVQVATEKLAALVYTASLRAGTPTRVDRPSASPAIFALQQNHPNPFNPSTMIRYSIGNQTLVTLKVYDALGREVRTLVNRELSAGTYEQLFDAGSLASGVYYYRIQVGGMVETKRMMLVR
jgi:hypothetical protein